MMSLLKAKEPIDEGSRVGGFSKLLAMVGSIWALELDKLGLIPHPLFCDLLTNCMLL